MRGVFLQELERLGLLNRQSRLRLSGFVDRDPNVDAAKLGRISRISKCLEPSLLLVAMLTASAFVSRTAFGLAGATWRVTGIWFAETGGPFCAAPFVAAIDAPSAGAAAVTGVDCCGVVG